MSKPELVKLLQAHEQSYSLMLQGPTMPDVPYLPLLSGLDPMTTEDVDLASTRLDVDQNLGARHWTRKTVKKMAGVVRDGMRPVEQETLDALIGKPLLVANLMTHNSPLSMATRLVPEEGGQTIVVGRRTSRRPSTALIHETLAIGYEALALTTWLVCNESDKAAVDEQIQQGRYEFVVLPVGMTTARAVVRRSSSAVMGVQAWRNAATRLAGDGAAELDPHAGVRRSPRTPGWRQVRVRQYALSATCRPCAATGFRLDGLRPMSHAPSRSRPNVHFKEEAMRNEGMQQLNVLVGSWRTTMRNAWFLQPADLEVPGEATAEWLGDAFVVFRWTMLGDVGEATREMVLVLGRSDPHDAYKALYHDERGVCRVYAMTFDGSHWELSRRDPDMFQRFIADVGPDRIAGRWEASDNRGSTWRKDFDLVFERA